MYLALERYSRPTSVEECLTLFAESGAALLAGGTDLNRLGHEEVAHVIDLQALGQTQVAGRGGRLQIGAGVTLSRLRHDALFEHLTALREAAAGYANVALQNRSTVGGRVMNPRGDQDVPAALLALGARLQISKLVDGKLEEAVIDYPTGDRSVLDGALLTAVQIPQGSKSAHRRFGRSAVDAPLACVSVCLDADGTTRVAVDGQGPGGLRRLTGLESLVASWNGSRPLAWRADARQAVLDELPAHEDAWASGAYRQDLTATLAVRALAVVLGEEEIA